MITIITNVDDYVRAWVAKKLGINSFGPSTAIGIQKNGELIAGCVYHDYRDGQIESSLASSTKSWANRSVLYSLFAYPFLQVKANRLLVTCAENNEKAMKMNRQLGFVPEGILRELYYPNDGIVWGMLKQECKWIKGNKNGQKCSAKSSCTKS